MPTLPPAGVTPAVSWDPTAPGQPAAPVGLLADSIDPNTGEFLSIATFVHPVDAAIQEQFRLELGSGVALSSQGQGFRQIEYVTEGTERQLEDEARRIMAPFLERGHARIIKVEPSIVGNDGGNVVVQYENLMTRRPARSDGQEARSA